MSVSLVSPSLRRRLLAGEEPTWLQRHIRRDYIVRVVLSAPPWVRPRDFKPFEERAAQLTKCTGLRHVVDHIVPVTHPLVCGLTVPWNMQVIDYLTNNRKSNKLHLSFQGELFDQPEQLALL